MRNYFHSMLFYYLCSKVRTSITHVSFEIKLQIKIEFSYQDPSQLACLPTERFAWLVFRSAITIKQCSSLSNTLLRASNDLCADFWTICLETYLQLHSIPMEMFSLYFRLILLFTWKGWCILDQKSCNLDCALWWDALFVRSALHNALEMLPALIGGTRS